MAGVAGFAGLAAVVVAQGAIIVKTRRQLDALARQVEQLASERDEAQGLLPGPALTGGRPTTQGADKAAGETPTARTLPPPRFVTPPEPSPPQHPVPQPVAFDTPQAREQLRQLIAAELENAHRNRRDRELQDREKEQRERIQAMIKPLGLSESEGKRLTEVLSSARTARQDLRQRIEAGQVERQDIGRAFQALRQQSDEQLRQMLGEDRMKKLQEMQGQDRRSWFGPEGRRSP